jgi:hypothetical protein
LTNEDKHALRLLFESRGWAIAQERAQRRIQLAKAEALANNDETKFLDLYHRAHAANNALVEFISDLSDLTEGE